MLEILLEFPCGRREGKKVFHSSTFAAGEHVRLSFGLRLVSSPCPQQDSHDFTIKTILNRFDGKMVPLVGIELTTYRLQGGCSTSELKRHTHSL
jgi:hypothetical protein